MAVGRGSVEVVAATVDPDTRMIKYQHTGLQPFSLDDFAANLNGLTIFLTMACATAEAAGYVRLLPRETRLAS